jgi:hypothetical protein
MLNSLIYVWVIRISYWGKHALKCYGFLQMTHDVKGRAITNRFTAPPELLEAWQATGGQVSFAEPATNLLEGRAENPVSAGPAAAAGGGGLDMSRQVSLSGEVEELGSHQAGAAVAAEGTKAIASRPAGADEALTGDAHKGQKRGRKAADKGGAATGGETQGGQGEVAGKKRRISKKAGEQVQQKRGEGEGVEVADAHPPLTDEEGAADGSAPSRSGQNVGGSSAPPPAAAAAAPAASSAEGFRSLFERPPFSPSGVHPQSAAAGAAVGEPGAGSEAIQSRTLTHEEEALIARGWAAITKSGSQMTLVARQRAQVLFEHLLIQGWLLKKVSSWLNGVRLGCTR